VTVAPRAERPPLWLVTATAAMAVALLVMAVTETSFKGQFLVDRGEHLSVAGLAFILAAGLHLHRSGRLAPSLPLVLPWLLYPVITQGDQIIDHLSIVWMRVIVHVLLAAIFAAPVAVIVTTARRVWSPSRRTLASIAVALFAAELWIAYQFLGWLMIGTLLALIAIVLAIASRPPGTVVPADRRHAFAVSVLVGGVALSMALYLGFKNRPGAYQGSPSHFMDPSQPQAGFDLGARVVPASGITWPADVDSTRASLQAYADALQTLLDGYYILDRNYNYHFHNELFLRATPLLPDYREAGLSRIRDAAARRAAGDRAAAAALAGLTAGDSVAVLIEDVRAYVAFNFARASLLERMSAEFERTPAGLQHATHLYEGEGKYLGVQLAALLDKHDAVLNDPGAAPMTGTFVAASRAIHDRYANRIVGF
jgi:hypothetical protein